MNNIDGIKKMSADELKKKREIILGMLGEDFNAPKSTNKKVDGILSAPKVPVSNVSRKMIAAAEKKHAEEQKKEWQEESRKNVLAGKEILAEIIAEKKIISPEPELEKKISKKTSKKKETTSVKKIINFDKALKKATGVKKRVVAKLKHSKSIFSYTPARIKRSLGKFAFVSLATILGLSVIYLSLFLLIVNYEIDNGFFRFLGKRLPMSALIVDNKFINFYDYIDTKNKLGGDANAAKQELIKNAIREDFFRKYKTRDSATLNRYTIGNEDVNSATLNRMRKIKKHVDDGGDFDQLAGKYGDRRESLNLGKDDFAKYDYGDKLKDLNANEVSDIIYSSDGYYLFKCYKKDDNSMSVSYISVQAKNFDQYVEETAKNIYYVSFVD